MGTAYKSDIIAWSMEQAALLRSGQFSALDIDNIAGEIEDIGKSEQRELSKQMSVLLSQLLKWQFQTQCRNVVLDKSIESLRKEITYNFNETPSLKFKINDEEWIDVVWAKAVSLAVTETGLDVFPDQCFWNMEQILNSGFFPEN